MVDQEKVLTWLTICGENSDCSGCCPYRTENSFTNSMKCMEALMRDALELLKEQPEQKFFVDSNGKITPLPIQKHAHWISVPDKSPKTTTINMYSFICSCSECGQSVGHHIEYNYCPRCGAKMDEGVKQDEDV